MSRADKFRNGVAGRAYRPKPDPVDTPGGLVQTQLATQQAITFLEQRGLSPGEANGIVSAISHVTNDLRENPKL